MLALGATAAVGQAQTPPASPSRPESDAPIRPVTRTEAVAAALARGATAVLARIDTATMAAQAAVAHAHPNPTLSTSFTQSAPQLHATVDVPVDFPAFRHLRTGAAGAALLAARLRLRGTEATVRYEVETVYGRAIAARERARLSARTGRDADSLVVLARLQRAAGDASDVDVELAEVNAGQLASAAAADSVGALGGLLELQLLMGLDADHVTIGLADSLPALLMEVASGAALDTGRVDAPPASVGSGRSAPQTTRSAPRASPPFRIAAAEATLRAQELSLRLARRRSALLPSLQLGVEGRDPTGGPQGTLAVVGLAVPLPIFNRYRGGIAVAEADRARARTELDVARRESAAAIGRARLEVAALRIRLERDRALLALADAVTAKTLTAYREGVSTLPAVLQAQRAARDAYGQFAADIVAAAAAVAALRLALVE